MGTREERRFLFKHPPPHESDHHFLYVLESMAVERSSSHTKYFMSVEASGVGDPSAAALPDGEVTSWRTEAYTL